MYLLGDPRQAAPNRGTCCCGQDSVCVTSCKAREVGQGEGGRR